MTSASTPDPLNIATRLAAVHERIAAAVARRGDGSPVCLVGVSKRQPVAALEAAVTAGLLDLGENYAQKLRDRRQDLPDPRIRWHFIGALQSNKIRYVVGAACIHTLDRVDLLAPLEARAARDDLMQSVLVQVNIAEEAGKAGIAPAQVPGLLDRFADLSHLRCDGLMLIPPAGTPEATRPHFRALRRLAEALARTHRPAVDLRELSMGMSGDFEVAIEEGATMVRVGTAVFGPRPPATQL